MHEAPTPSALLVQDEVRQAFGWSEADDVASALQLQQSLHVHELWNVTQRDKTLMKIKKQLLNAERVVVVGAAAQESELQTYGPNTAYVAADGSVGALQDYSGLACIVSDLDGGIYLDTAARHAIPILVHAHGDNVAQWQKKIEQWGQFNSPPPLVLSHQVNQMIPGMHNFGGFTDGDRALCFVLSLGVQPEKIELVGFSLNHVGQWSGVTDIPKKLQKLQWMQRIVSKLGFGHFIQQ